MAYQLTPKRLAAARANLAKAWAAHRAGKVPWPARPPALKHGFFALDLRQSVIQLGEDVQEYDEHLRRFQRVFTPLGETEERIVRRMAEAAWRLLRGYRARAHAQTKKLRKALETVAPHAPLDIGQTKRLALYLVEMFWDEHYIVNCVSRLRNQFERLFRVLLIKRTGSDYGFRIFSNRRLSKWDQAVPFV